MKSMIKFMFSSFKRFLITLSSIFILSGLVYLNVDNIINHRTFSFWPFDKPHNGPIEQSKEITKHSIKIIDEVNTLNQLEKKELNLLLRKVEALYGFNFNIHIKEDLDGVPIESYSFQVLDQNKNIDLILVLDINNRTIRIDSSERYAHIFDDNYNHSMIQVAAFNLSQDNFYKGLYGLVLNSVASLDVHLSDLIQSEKAYSMDQASLKQNYLFEEQLSQLNNKFKSMKLSLILLGATFIIMIVLFFTSGQSGLKRKYSIGRIKYKQSTPREHSTGHKVWISQSGTNASGGSFMKW